MTVTLLRQFELDSVSVNFFVEKHGKGRNDGSFGLQRKWVSNYTETKDILDSKTYVAAVWAGARETMSLDPPPQGPEYIIVHFTPPPKPAHVLRLSVPGFQVDKTYCLKAIRVKRAAIPKDTLHATDVKLHNFVYSDRMQGSVEEDLGAPTLSKDPVAQLDWRLAYRTSYPEKAWSVKPQKQTSTLRFPVFL